VAALAPGRQRPDGRLECRIDAIFEVMQLVAEEAGYGHCTEPIDGPRAGSYDAAVAVQRKRADLHLVTGEGQ